MVESVGSTQIDGRMSLEGRYVGLTVGARLCAQNSSCEVIVIRGSESSAALLCAGAEMLPARPAESIPQATDGPVLELGKRYSDDEIEVLCTKAGIGPLVYGEHELTLKTAKALPASD
jgi:hypothetical protein